MSSFSTSHSPTDSVTTAHSKPNGTSIKIFGVTQPINSNPPTDLDIELTKSMLETLESMGYSETPQESRRRESVLGKLNLMVKEFVREVGVERGLPDFILSECGGKIFTFGSYRLGVHRSGADIDTLCVVPQHVERVHFFTRFYDTLQHCSEISELTQVPDAYVPVIKMVFCDIPIDLVFARLSMPTVPEDLDLLDHSILRNLDEKCILSLNGSRTTDEILRLVPNVSTFHAALKCIKTWAKRRGVYGNSTGYFAGVTCAMLVARICQLYPNAAPFTIVCRFFKIYSQWAWPQPVLLKPIEDVPYLHMKVWNPKIYQADRLHRMPVITPAFPSMCSTHNVSQSTQMIIQQEFIRGIDVMLRIEQKQTSWSELFAKSEFFHTYKNFIQLIAVSHTKEQHKIWSGYVESKVRHLTGKLEYAIHIAAVPPFPEMFEYESTNKDIQSILDYHCRLETKPISEPSSDASSEKHDTTENAPVELYSAAFYIAICLAPKQTPGPIRLDIHRPVAEFKEFITKWDKFEEGMELIIRDLKRDDLPDYLYEPGQRPSRIRRTKPSSKSDASSTQNETLDQSPDEKNFDLKSKSTGAKENPAIIPDSLEDAHNFDNSRVHQIPYSPTAQDFTKKPKENNSQTS